MNERGKLAKFAKKRKRMVESQLAQRGITDFRVLTAMANVPREQFVRGDLQRDAYGDHALPIEQSQTISQPYTVAFMAQAAQLSSTDKVLEIGTGSGYGAAVLSQLADEVHTVERIADLAIKARERLVRLGYSNVIVHEGDGTLGLPTEMPFDAIVVTAGAKILPAPYFEQLRDGGRLVIPIGETPRRQTMHRFLRRGKERVDEDLGGFAFVPLIGAYGWES